MRLDWIELKIRTSLESHILEFAAHRMRIRGLWDLNSKASRSAALVYSLALQDGAIDTICPPIISLCSHSFLHKGLISFDQDIDKTYHP